jgi:hypothetical protein
MNIKSIKGNLWFWYVVIGLATVAAYPHIVNLLEQQFSVYKIHMGNPASYIVVFALFGWWFDRFYKQKTHRKTMGVLGNILLVVGLVILTLILKFGFGYQFWF